VGVSRELNGIVWIFRGVARRWWRETAVFGKETVVFGGFKVGEQGRGVEHRCSKGI